MAKQKIHTLESWGNQHKVQIDGILVSITTIRHTSGRYSMVPYHVEVVAPLQEMRSTSPNKTSYAFTFWESKPEMIRAVTKAMSIVSDWITAEEKRRDDENPF